MGNPFFIRVFPFLRLPLNAYKTVKSKFLTSEGETKALQPQLLIIC
ncbi:UNVERIFIED_CONTAM: hypothetical protein ABID98_005848 [Brevibacillus sp. OAP136]